MSKMKLFCFPYAGGSSAMYEKWKKTIHNSIELIPIEYSGRGKRFSEPLLNNMDETVNDIYKTIKNDLNSSPYAFFGHSMGSIVSYELAHKLKKLNHSQPSHIFFSGKAAPNIKSRNKAIHALENEEFKQELFKLEGTPKEILENKELMEVFLPILRSDFKIIEEYLYKDDIEKLESNITILYGKDDDMNLNEICDWQKHTNKKCNYIKFPGGHFFINNHTDEIVSIVNTMIAI